MVKQNRFTVGLLIAVLCLASTSHAQGKGKGKGHAEAGQPRAEKTDQGARTQDQTQAPRGKALAEEKKAAAQTAGKRADRSGQEAGSHAPKTPANPGKGKGKQQQGKAFAKQIEHERAKHLTRQTRLQRILELAEKKKDPKIIARVQSLMEKELSRYEKTSQRLQAKAQLEGLDEVNAQTAGQTRKTAAQDKGQGKSKDRTGKGSEQKEDDDEHQEAHGEKEHEKTDNTDPDKGADE